MHESVNVPTCFSFLGGLHNLINRTRGFSLACFLSQGPGYSYIEGNSGVDFTLFSETPKGEQKDLGVCSRPFPIASRTKKSHYKNFGIYFLLYM